MIPLTFRTVVDGRVQDETLNVWLVGQQGTADGYKIVMRVYRRDAAFTPIYQQRSRNSCYWPTASSCADRACVFTIADFSIIFARVGTQTHMDLSELPLCRDWEPMATMTNRATANRPKRLMG
jgi:hypothetical protein